MATKLKPVGNDGVRSDADEYVDTLSALDEALRAERAAHVRLMGIARRIEKQDAPAA